jgi:hypothetical protein
MQKVKGHNPLFIFYISECRHWLGNCIVRFDIEHSPSLGLVAITASPINNHIYAMHLLHFLSASMNYKVTYVPRLPFKLQCTKAPFKLPCTMAS